MERAMFGLKAALNRLVCASAIALAVSFVAPQGRAEQAAPVFAYAEQGWTDAQRNTFYTTSQGSRLIPLAWFKALRRHDVDAPFGADQLKRYGYLQNDSPANVNKLPVGFVVDRRAPTQLGLTCAACHTNQIEYQKDGVTRVLRIDGAPALADAQQFFADLTAASRATLADAKFKDFAKAVLGPNPPNNKVTQLRKDFEAWVMQLGDFADRSLPASPWGPGRLDAFGMIFNRVTGKDLGIAANFRTADAPVSYPFLWNASRQDRTQWNGGVPNGLFIHALGRNTGEVLGVFADFVPSPRKPQLPFFPKFIDFTSNSADFGGLQTLEEQITQLKPPRWRDFFDVNDTLAAKGEVLFKTHCAECHEAKDSPLLGKRAWETKVKAVGTDPRMIRNAERMVDPGLLIDTPLPLTTPLPPIGAVFENPAGADKVLASSVAGSLIAEAVPHKPVPPSQLLNNGVWRAFRKDLGNELSGAQLDLLLNPAAAAQVEGRIKALLADLFKQQTAPGAPAAYESRVLDGIWATAPYLHNGSVPNLWELLKPAKDRITTFKVGSRKYDTKNVGFATDESPFANGTFVVDPANANGNGNGGHEYGTGLNEDQRWAIVEYLKIIKAPN
jgi:hypothetical protein